MAPPVTEFAILPLAAGVSAEKGSDGHKIMMESFATIKKQPGCGNIFYGPAVEDPSKFYMVIDWDTLDAHSQFMKLPEYKPFVDKMMSVMGGGPVLQHVPFDSHPPTKALDKSIGATEILTVYFPTDVSKDDTQKFENGFRDFGKRIKESWKGTFEVTTGWVMEEQDYEKAPGGKAKAWRALIGWDSVQAHKDCKETQVFQDGIHIVRQAPGSIGLSLDHIEAQEYKG